MLSGQRLRRLHLELGLIEPAAIRRDRQLPGDKHQTSADYRRAVMPAGAGLSSRRSPAMEALPGRDAALGAQH